MSVRQMNRQEIRGACRFMDAQHPEWELVYMSDDLMFFEDEASDDYHIVAICTAEGVKEFSKPKTESKCEAVPANWAEPMFSNYPEEDVQSFDWVRAIFKAEYPRMLQVHNCIVHFDMLCMLVHEDKTCAIIRFIHDALDSIDRR